MIIRHGSALKRRLRNWIRYLAWLPAVFVVLQVAMWAFDRSVPRTITGYIVASVPAGGETVVIINMTRDNSRGCSADVNRYFTDSSGTRFVISGNQHHTASMTEFTEHTTPSVLRIPLRVPPTASRGRGHLVSTIEYTCNPLHIIWPIQWLIVQDVEVL